MIYHPFTDILAHPDAYLGNFDARRCNWKKVFKKMEERGILCEYNLTSPLVPDIFNLATEQSGLIFAITSDIHDFRECSTRRLMDAWSESCAGGFQIAFDYLRNILSGSYSGLELDELIDRFSTHEKLSEIENRVYLCSRGNRTNPTILDETEKKIFQGLNNFPFGQPDRNFLLNRLKRFIHVPAERIATILPINSFVDLIHSGREKRASLSTGL
jgi:hypothetical protein